MALLSSAVASANPPFCPELVARFVTLSREAAIGTAAESPAEHAAGWAEARPDMAEGLRTLDALRELESDIIDIFTTAPELRGTRERTAAARHGMTPEEFRDVELYYAVRIFGDLSLVAERPETALARLRELHRDATLTGGATPLARRYLYYLFSITQKSVPQIAEELGFSEHAVRGELSQLGISIVAEYERPLGAGRAERGRQALEASGRSALQNEVRADRGLLETLQALVDRGLTPAEAARALGAGERAAEFILHHVHEINRGVPWSRTFDFEGTPTGEEAILTALYRRGWTSQRIADELNRLAGRGPDDLDYRTAAAVLAKAARLIPTVPPPHATPPDVPDPGGGWFKRNGELVPANALAFIGRHFFLPDRWLAQQLGVNVRSLRDFLQRHGVPPERRRQAPPAPAGGAGTPPASALRSGYARQRDTRAVAVQLNELGRLPRPEARGAASERRLYEFMSRHAEDPVFLEALTPERRGEVEQWNRERVARAASMGAEAFADAVNRLGRRPRAGAREQSGDAASAEEARLYSLLYLHADKPAFLDRLAPELRRELEAWNAARREGAVGPREAAEGFAAFGRLPRTRNFAGLRAEARTPEQQRESLQYSRLLRFARDPVFLAHLPPPLRRAVEESTRRRDERTLDPTTLAEQFNLLGRIPEPLPRVRAADATPEQRREKRLYQRLRNGLAENETFLAALTPEMRERVTRWNTTRLARQIGPEGAAAGIVALGRLPRARGTARRADGDTPAARSEGNFYALMQDYAEHPDFLAALPEALRTEVETWNAARRAREIGPAAAAARINALGRLPGSPSIPEDASAEVVAAARSERSMRALMAGHADNADFQAALAEPIRVSLRGWITERDRLRSLPRTTATALNARGRMPRALAPGEAAESPERQEEHLLYRRLLSWSDNEPFLALLSPAMREVVRRWNEAREVGGIRAAALEINVLGALPTTDNESLYRRMYSHRDDPAFRNALNEERRADLDAWLARLAAREVLTPVTAAAAVDALGRLPRGVRPKRGEPEHPDTRERGLYHYMQRNATNAEFLAALSAPRRAEVEAWQRQRVERNGQRRPRGLAAAATNLNAFGRIPAPQGSRIRTLEGEARAAAKREEQAYRDMVRYGSNPAFVAALSPPLRAPVQEWARRRDERAEATGPAAVGARIAELGRLPQSRQSHVLAHPDDEAARSEQLLYEGLARHAQSAELLAALTPELQAAVRAWHQARAPRAARGPAAAAAEVNALGRLPRSLSRRPGAPALTPEERAERLLFSRLQRYGANADFLAALTPELRALAQTWQAQRARGRRPSTPAGE